jgi:hypothetical protein
MRRHRRDHDPMGEVAAIALGLLLALAALVFR